MQHYSVDRGCVRGQVWAKVPTVHGAKRLAEWFGSPGYRYLTAELPATTATVTATTRTGKARVSNTITLWQLAGQLF